MNEYRIVFEDKAGDLHDFTVVAPDYYIARDCGAEMMRLDEIEGQVIEVTEV